MSGSITFPPNPTVGQIYTVGTQSWEWNGTQWVNATAGQNFLPLTGGTLTGPLTMPSGTVTNGLAVTAGGLTATPNVIVGNAVLSNNGLAWNGTSPAAPVAFAQDATGALNLWVSGGSQGNVIRSSLVSGTQFPVLSLAVNAALTTAIAPLGAGAGTASWAISTSDRRLKRNIQPAGDALAIVKNLAVYTADQINVMTDEVALHLDFAVIADEVEKLLPSAYMAPVDEHSYAHVNPLYLITALWRAVQQLSEQVASLQNPTMGAAE